MAEKTYTLGERMRAYRGRNGLTQRQLGELLGVKQTDISVFENNRKEPPPELKAAFNSLLEEAAAPGVEAGSTEPTTPNAGKAVEVLLAEITAARQEMGRPIAPEEADALARMDAGELLSQSILLREALEVQASRELLAGAKAFRRKRETARNGGGRSC